MGTNRAERLAGALQKKISEILHRHIKDPRIGFVTITAVKVSKDLKHVKVYFSVLGDEKQKKSAAVGLERATGFVRRLIAREISLRFVPEIVFKYDELSEYQEHINELFRRIETKEKKNEPDKESD